MNCTGLRGAFFAPRMGLRDPRGALRMPFSHFRGTRSGGFTPPVASTGSGGFIPPVASTRRGQFTLNRFTVSGFSLPVDAIRHGCSHKPFRICTYEKCARNSPAICTYKSLDLNFLGINTYKKQGVEIGRAHV